MMKNVTLREDLVAPLAARVGGSPAEARRYLTAALAVLADALRAGQSVQLNGLGSFFWLPTLERQRRNPGTGEPVIVPAGRRLRFKPGSRLKQRREVAP